MQIKKKNRYKLETALNSSCGDFEFNSNYKLGEDVKDLFTHMFRCLNCRYSSDTHALYSGIRCSFWFCLISASVFLLLFQFLYTGQFHER